MKPTSFIMHNLTPHITLQTTGVQAEETTDKQCLSTLKFATLFNGKYENHVAAFLQHIQ